MQCNATTLLENREQSSSSSSHRGDQSGEAELHVCCAIRSYRNLEACATLAASVWLSGEAMMELLADSLRMAAGPA